MNSCLYEGRVRHRRFIPKPHAFNYRIFYAYLDLDELDQVFDGRWLWSTRRAAPAWFRRADHLGPARQPLKRAVSDVVKQHAGRAPQGPIYLLTLLRYFGYGFNPVSFYYCFDKDGARVETIVAEVSNTPWGEHHLYVLPQPGENASMRHTRFHLDKAFHVSPFMPMDIHYDWVFTTPGKRLSVHMANYQGREKIFDASLSLRQKPINAINCAQALLRYPFMTLKVITAIYWQALRLLLKGNPIYTHPSKLDSGRR